MIACRRLALALAAVTVAAAPTPGDPPRSPDVPPGAAAVAVFHVGDFLRSTAGEAALKQLRESAPHALPGLERLLGVSLAHIETVTAIVPTMTDRNDPWSAALTVDLNTSHDPAELVKALQEPDLDSAGLPTGVYPLKDTVEGTFSVAGPQRFTVFTTERARREYAALWLRRDGPGLPTVGEKSLLALTARPGNAPSLQGLRFGFVSLGRRELLPLTEAATVMAQADLHDTMRLQVQLTFTDTADAIRGEKALEPARGLMLSYLGFQVQEAQRRNDHLKQDAVETLRSATRTATVNRSGPRLVIQAELAPTAPSAAWLSGLVHRPTPPDPDYASGHLKQIAYAMHEFYDGHERLPPPAIYDNDGQPLLSWRVALLPYLGQSGLYRHFRLNEPWDSEHNKKLLAQMPDIYRLTPPGPVDAGEAVPADGVPEKWRTHFRVLVGGGAAFERRQQLRFAEFTDGLSNTILVATGLQSVPWTKPEELPYDPNKLPPALRRSPTEGPLVVLADGSVQRLPAGLKTPTLRALITRAGGEVIVLDEK